jgi:hypothetical protein
LSQRIVNEGRGTGGFKVDTVANPVSLRRSG